MKTMTIGQVARQAGVGVETLRFYEREGLLEQPTRRESGYRQYAPAVVDRLRFIQRAKVLGFTLREIKELLHLHEDEDATRADVKRRAVAKIVDIEAKIEDLRRMRATLGKLAEACDGDGPLHGCPIIEALSGPAMGPSQDEGEHS